MMHAAFPFSSRISFRRTANPRTTWASAAFSALLVICGWLDSAQAVSVAFSPEEQLGPCMPQEVHTAFSGATGRHQIRVLVTRFAGSTEIEKQFGMQVGNTLRSALASYARDGLDLQNSGLSATGLHVRFIPCVIGDHDHARQIGRAANAEVVLWGQTYCDRHNAMACQHVDLHLGGVNSNSIENSPGAKIVNRFTIKTPSSLEPEDAFKTSLTVVRWAGLDGDSENPIRIRSRVELAGAHLPQLASRRVRLLLNFVLGLYALRAGRHGLAVQFFDSVEKVSAGVEGAYDLHRIVGTSFVIAGQPERGLLALQKAHDLCESDDNACLHRTSYRLGWAEERMGHSSAALKHYQAALELAQEKNRWIEGSTLGHMGRIYVAIGDNKRGQKLCEQAQEICIESRARSCAAEAIRTQGDVASNLGLTSKAAELYEQALRTFRQAGDLGGEAATLNSQGRNYLTLGDKRLAQECHEQALARYRKVGDQKGIADTLDGLGHVAECQGDTQTAKTLYDQALAIATLAKDPRGEATILSSQGRIIEGLDRPKARELYEKALSLYKQAEDSQGAAAMLDSLGKVLADLGQFAESIADAQKSATLFMQRNPPDLTRAMASLQRGFRLADQNGLVTEAAALKVQMSHLVPE